MSDPRSQGVVNFKINGDIHRAFGEFNYNLGLPKLEVLESDAGGVVGYTEKPQPAFIECDLFVPGDLEVSQLLRQRDASVTLELRNGKVITIEHAWVESDGNVNAQNGKLKVKFCTDSAGVEIVNI